MNTFNKKTPIAATSTASPRSLSASKITDSATSSPTGPFPFRSSSNPGFGRSWNPRLSSRNQRPSSPLSQMRPCAYLWNKMSNTLKRKMLRISFQDVERGLQEAKTEATTYFATGLVNLGNRLHHRELLINATALTASAHDAEASIYTLGSDIREGRSRLNALQVQQRSTTAALEPSTREHRRFNAGYRTHPCTQSPGTGISATVPPLQARPHPANDPTLVLQPHATLDTRLATHTQLKRAELTTTQPI